ncbi:YggT family protein [Roseospira marina]|uniref:YggT family protein n=1 Tax=Roseospira marina TaxID=140057 RepID=A0A5M6I837_9PROT|nr:YggT family protein [Roseospira marina]KAA5604333.1 YggT family protein [Roseospira marina]MBB4315641.1 YggT family protein [Roseospira marina]MBB5088699.1 YggT family protein [Roseospira marina]
MDVIIAPLFQIVLIVIRLYIWVIIIQAILSWLIAFNVINTYNRFVGSISEVLYRLTEPALAPIRRRLPAFGGVDLSPVVLILILVFIQMVLTRLMFKVL